MATERDLKLSRKMQKLVRKFQELVRKEMGQDMGVAVIVWPWAEKEDGEIAEFQYASNAHRSFMHERLKELVKKWDKGEPDSPPHERH
jgi:hypothetical protein